MPRFPSWETSAATIRSRPAGQLPSGPAKASRLRHRRYGRCQRRRQRHDPSHGQQHRRLRLNQFRGTADGHRHGNGKSQCPAVRANRGLQHGRLTQVSAGGNISVQGTGAISGILTSTYGGASVFGRRDFSGTVTAAQAASGHGDGERHRQQRQLHVRIGSVYAWGGGGGITVSGSQGATLLSYQDLTSAG